MPQELKARPRLRYPVAVEGKYDKIKLESLFEGEFFVTNGFSLFKDQGKKTLFRRLAEKTPIIVFTDSDSAGRLIRNHFKGILPADRLIHLYIPQVKGKERRKSAPSREGYLGVEGSDSALLRSIFAPYVLGEEPVEEGGESPFQKSSCPQKGNPLKRSELYELGYEGGTGSREKRKELLRLCGLPDNLSTAAMLEALNLLYTREELERLLGELKEQAE